MRDEQISYPCFVFVGLSSRPAVGVDYIRIGYSGRHILRDGYLPLDLGDDRLKELGLDLISRRTHSSHLRAKANGLVACWGDGSHGKASYRAPEFAAVSAGHSHTCAVKADGSVDCWGNDSYGTHKAFRKDAMLIYGPP